MDLFSKKSEQIARWIFKTSLLDADKETWNSMMLEELTERIHSILEENFDDMIKSVQKILAGN